jgi:hypothetical protein
VGIKAKLSESEAKLFPPFRFEARKGIQILFASKLKEVIFFTLFLPKQTRKQCKTTRIETNEGDENEAKIESGRKKVAT